MSTTAKRRLMRDFKRLQTDPPEGVSGAPCPDNVLVWNAVIFGPSETPFEDGTFKLILVFDEEYPVKPPNVKFVSKMFHPNVYANGDLCLDILQNRWSPTYDVAAILTSIQSLLHDPNPNSPANVEAARLFSESRKEYYKRVRETKLQELEKENFALKHRIYLFETSPDWQDENAKESIFIEYTRLKAQEAVWMQERSPREASMEKMLEEKEIEMEQLCEEYECMQTLCGANQAEMQRLQQELSSCVRELERKQAELQEMEHNMNEMEHVLRQNQEECMQQRDLIDRLEREAGQFDIVSANAFAELKKLENVVKAQDEDVREKDLIFRNLEKELREKDEQIALLKNEILRSCEKSSKNRIVNRLPDPLQNPEYESSRKIAEMEQELMQTKKIVANLRSEFNGNQTPLPMANNEENTQLLDMQLENNKRKFIDGLKKRNATLVQINGQLSIILGMSPADKKISNYLELRECIFEKLQSITTIQDYYKNMSKEKQYWITKCDSLEQRLKNFEPFLNEFKRVKEAANFHALRSKELKDLSKQFKQQMLRNSADCQRKLDSALNSSKTLEGKYRKRCHAMNTVLKHLQVE